MNEDVKSENVRIHSRADELIACLEGEIAKRDARIAELEARYQRDVYGLNNEGDPIGGDPAGGYANDNARLRAELAAIKAQGVVMPDVNAAAKALCNRHAMICGVDADDQWKEYSQDFIADAETVLANARLYAAPAAPAADAGLVEALDYQALFDAIAAATSVYASGAINISVQAFRDALAANRAKGVV